MRLGGGGGGGFPLAKIGGEGCHMFWSIIVGEGEDGGTFCQDGNARTGNGGGGGGGGQGGGASLYSSHVTRVGIQDFCLPA